MRDTTDVDTCPRCQKCDRWRAAPDVLRDPMLLWERFPCPPPGTDHTRLLLELDWTGQIGTPKGCEALSRVARRCHVDLNQINDIPSALVECEELFSGVGLCGTQCVIAVILAVICLFFVLLLIVVCRRYVRGTNKESSMIRTKVLTPEHAAVNTQQYKYYVQNQYFHRPNNIPERRRLPCEARLVENGVEARLLKAIKETPVHHYNVEDLCPQCQAESRNNTLKYTRTRPGYEPICWKEKEYFQKRVPSMDSINRKSISYQRSNNGSSSDVSHLYEYISDYPYMPSYNSTERTPQSHSPKLYSRSNSLKRNNSQNKRDYNKSAECETLLHQNVKKENGGFKNEIHPSRRSVTSIHSRYDERSPYARYWTERSPYEAGGSEPPNYQPRVCDKVIYKGYTSDVPPDLISGMHTKSDSGNKSNFNSNKRYSDNLENESDITKQNLETQPVKATSGEQLDGPKSIKGYTYSFNPSYYDRPKQSTTTTAMPKLEPNRIENSPTDNGIGRSRHKRKAKTRRQSSGSYNSNGTESTSLSGSYNASVFQKDNQ